MGQKPQCRECFRAADGPDPVLKLSGTVPPLQPCALLNTCIYHSSVKKRHKKVKGYRIRLIFGS